jgi:assimilatory nitrate reductase catalytic subunit
MPSIQTVKTTCPYCGVGCGVIASLDDSGIVSISGHKQHPSNFGRLCSKGSALAETVSLQDRLLYPEIDNQQVSWEQAIATVAGRFNKIINEHGPDAIAFYVSGQLLTEDYYVANKLMKGFIGSANIDTNSRLCMSSAVSGYKRAFGEDCVPTCYEDLDRAKLIILTGSNTAWCHPVVYQRIVSAKKINPDLKVVVIDPRKTQTTALADLFLPIKPGTDAILFNGLLLWIEQHQETNTLFVNNYTRGVEQALDAARQSSASLESIAHNCGLSVEQVEQFYRLFARTERVVTLFSQGINQSSSGTDKVNSIINCHLLSGRISRPGMGPFSITGQPNAMGGREVGGLANQLAAHMEIDNPIDRDRVQRFWQSPTIATRNGYKAVELFDAIADGKIKAVWIMATNPVVSLPEANKVKQALQQCELVVTSDCVRLTDTTEYAHIRLPALSWGERDGTVTNSERRISRQNAFLPHPGRAKADWEIISLVAQQMGFAEHFSYQHAGEVFCEHAALSGFENNHQRQFDISALATLTKAEYDQLQPIQWPVNQQAQKGTKRLFTDGRFNTEDHKARFIPITPRMPANQPNLQHPYILNTGRLRDHWHTMTRTEKSPRLSSHIHESYLEIHPLDAKQCQLENGNLATVSSEHGTIQLRVQISDKQQIGSVFVPMHWNQHFSSNARVGSLIKAITDPVSGQPEYKHSIVNIAPVEYAWHGFILSRNSELQPEYAEYWNKSRGKGLWRYEIAGNSTPQQWASHARKLLQNDKQANRKWIEFFDTASHHYRAASFQGDALNSCLFIGSDIHLPPRDWLISLFDKDSLSQDERNSLLTGKAPGNQQDTGPVICACFNIGEQKIRETIAAKNLQTPEEIGECLKAGTNCGSCIPELRGLLEQSQTNALV